jgi:hypothetical protein
MGACAEEGALGDAYMGAEGDGGEAEDEDFVADPDVIPDGETPGEGDVDAGADDETAADPSAKEAKQSDAKRGGPWKGVEEEKTFAEDPEGFLKPAGTAVEIGVVVEVQSHWGGAGGFAGAVIREGGVP